MTTAAALLREARGGTGRTQADLERLSGVRQTAISQAERGRQDLTVTALERLVHAAGWRVTVLPTQAGSVADAADTCRQYLAAGSEDGAYRAVIQLADWLGSEHGAERVALTVTPLHRRCWPAASSSTQPNSRVSDAVGVGRRWDL